MAAYCKTGQRVISNQPDADPHSGGLPRGHPPLNAFMGLPFYGGGKLLGMVGIANRDNGYDRETADALHPFLVACGNLIQAYRNNRKRQYAEKKLSEYRRILLARPADIPLGRGYVFSRSPASLSWNDNPVLLSRKELSLLEILALNLNRPVATPDIETHVWPETIVGASSLRSLRAPEKIDYPNFVIGLIVTNHDSRSGFLSNRFSNSRMACLLRDTPAL